MESFIIPPLVKWSLGALGAAAVVHWVVKEVHRVNEELHRAKPIRVAEPVRRDRLPTLRRDPYTGEYRL
jgi:hypothetical protein